MGLEIEIRLVYAKGKPTSRQYVNGLSVSPLPNGGGIAVSGHDLTFWGLRKGTIAAFEVFIGGQSLATGSLDNGPAKMNKGDRYTLLLDDFIRWPST